MNLPNKITLLRVFLIPLFIIFFFVKQIPFSSAICLIIFIGASITDFIDGYLARKYNLVTTFGKFVDPLADKLLVMSALVCFCFEQPFGIWTSIYTIIILAREFTVTGFRTIAASEGVVIAAGKSGKLKTVTQMLAIICMMIDRFMLIPFNISFILMTVAVLLTIYSGTEYLVMNKNLIKTK